MTAYENTYSTQTHTLSRFVNEHVVNVWDVAALGAAELITIKDNISEKPSASLVLVELKSRTGARNAH